MSEYTQIEIPEDEMGMSDYSKLAWRLWQETKLPMTICVIIDKIVRDEGYRKQNVGEWIESYSYGVWHYDCPFCHDGYAVEEREKSPEHFCNNCGAKLDGAIIKKVKIK